MIGERENNCSVGMCTLHLVQLEGDWSLHLSGVRQAIPLTFAFDRINYKRWLPIYYEDCLQLEERYPLLHKAFMQGDFVAKHSNRSGSCVPMDQALEKAYNKPAKDHSGIIGITRKKEAVAKWCIIKHEKQQFTDLLYNLCSLDMDDEYSLHHEFSTAVTKADEICVTKIRNFIAQRENPFDTDRNTLKNVATGAVFSESDSNFFKSSIEVGEKAFDEFRRT